MRRHFRDPPWTGACQWKRHWLAARQPEATRRLRSRLPRLRQILWAGNGNIPTDAVSAATKKVIPSARKTYPIELYLVCGEGTVEKLPAGVYHYDADRHALQRIVDGDRRKPMSSACKGQSWIASAPVSVIVGSVLAASRGYVRIRAWDQFRGDGSRQRQPEHPAPSASARV